MKYITLEEFCTCSQTYQKFADQIDPYPWQPESVDAIASLLVHIIDPIIDYFGRENFQLTYGFCSVDLRIFLEKHDPETGKKNGRVCPNRDQHMSCEVKRDGSFYCDRLGAAADFFFEGVPSSEIISFVRLRHLPFDSLYYYGDSRPIHLTYGPQNKRAAWGFKPDGSPQRLTKYSF